MISNKIRAVLLCVALLLGVPLLTAAPAAAASQYENCWGYGYTATVNVSYGSNVNFNSWSITGSNPQEYRVRWFAPAGNVIYDTGYVAWTGSNPSGYPGMSRYFTNSSQILVNVGKYGDGHATCEVWFGVSGV